MALPRQHHPGEEIANALTHGLGAITSLGAAAVLITLAAVWGHAVQIVSAAIFGGSLVLLYVASTLYHSIPHPRAKRLLKVLDHCAIYILIAGTYTPFALIALRDHGGDRMLGVIWALAFIGVLFKLFYAGRFEILSTAIYLAMGWIGVFAIEPMLHQVPGTTLLWLLAGGIAYTLGTVFYLNRRLPYAHAVWHLFVLAGSTAHFIAVAQQLLVGPNG